MNAIVAADRNWGIGRDGTQFCYLPPDLKRFRTLTLGKTVILGRKTLATFPQGKPLKGRRNLILSRTLAEAPEGAELCRSLPELLERAPEDAFVIGGGRVYAALLDRCRTVYVTRLDRSWPADTWFPDLDRLPEWQIVREEEPLCWEGLSFRYITYGRK